MKLQSVNTSDPSLIHDFHFQWLFQAEKKGLLINIIGIILRTNPFTKSTINNLDFEQS